MLVVCIRYLKFYWVKKSNRGPLSCVCAILLLQKRSNLHAYFPACGVFLTNFFTKMTILRLFFLDLFEGNACLPNSDCVSSVI